MLEDATTILSPRMRQLLANLRQEWLQLENQIETMSQQIERVAKQSEACQRLMNIPRVGPLAATALLAAIGNASVFRKGRDLAAWMGLVSR